MGAKLGKGLLAALVVLSLLLSAVPALAQNSPDIAERLPAASELEVSEAQTEDVCQVTLITGDVVTVVTSSDGKRSFAISPAEPNKAGQHFLTIKEDDNTYIFPDGADIQKLDRELFNIDYLVDEEYYNESSLPLLVSYAPSLPKSRVESLEGKISTLGQETELHDEVYTISTRLDYENISASHSNLMSQPEVEKVWLDKKVHALLIDSIPLIGAEWWWATTGNKGEGQKIAILDTGIDSSHPALDDLDDNPATNDPKVIVNVNFTDDASFDDLYGHGTHCAGIAAGTEGSPQAHSGLYAWFSGADNNLNNALTRTFDLTAVSSANITFWTLYDMEPGCDYGYLKISTDNGTTWTTLDTYNGGSGDTFTQLSYDLSPYIGQNILVRFEYVTDSSVIYRGWYIDDIEIPEIAFYDDVESGPGNWTSVGWTITEMVYQGVAPRAQLWNVKVLNQWGYGYESWIINGINFASLGSDGVPETGDEADVISMSLGGGPSDGTDPMSQAVNLAVDRNVVVVVAAGNEGPYLFTIASPGVAEKAITVGATDKADTLADFSSRGPTIDLRVKPDILAPGVDITSSVPGEGYESWSGTSMATPHVAGAAALLRQYYGDTVSPQFIKDALMYTAKDLGYTVYEQGSGRLDLMWEPWPIVGVTPATVSMGLLSPGLPPPPAPILTFFTDDTSPHDVTLTAGLIDVISGVDHSESVTLDPASFTVPAQGQIDVSLNIDLASLPASVFGGKVVATVDDGASKTIQAIFGFAKLGEVTIHKTDINGEPAQGHPVWVLMESPIQTMWEEWQETDESGDFTFYAVDGSYHLISPNWGHEENQVTIWTIAENVAISGDTTIDLDERDTLLVDFDPNKAGQVVPTKVSGVYYDYYCSWESLWWYPNSFLTRVSPISRFDASFTYSYYPQEDFNSGDPSLVNTGEWHNLRYSVTEISTDRTFVADYGNLVHRQTGYCVALNAERAYWLQLSWDDIAWWPTGFIYLMDAPQGRWEWLSPEPVTYVQQYGANQPWGEWNFQGYTSYPVGEYDWRIGCHPLTSGVDVGFISGPAPEPAPPLGAQEVNCLSIWGPISRDSANNDFWQAVFSGHITVTQDDEVVLDDDIWDDFWGEVYFEGTPEFTVEIWGETPLELSRSSYTRLDFTADPAHDYRPPRLTPGLRVPGMDLFGVRPGGEVEVQVRVTDDSPLDSVHLHYSLDDGGTWNDAGLPVFEEGWYVFNLGELQETFVTIAVDAEDSYGNHIHYNVNRAIYTTVVTTYDVPLVSGWNLISLPLIPGSNIEDVLAGIMTDVESVWAYDGATQTWSFFVPGGPPSLTEMTEGKGYWVNVTNPCVLTVEGTEPSLPHDIPLVSGWNLTGLPLFAGSTNIEDILSDIMTDIESVWAYDGATQTWSFFVPGGPPSLTEMTEGKGYWFNVTNPCTLTITGS